MARIIDSTKTGCTVKNVHISQFQNPLQTNFSMHTTYFCLSESKLEKQTISGDPVSVQWKVFKNAMEGQLYLVVRNLKLEVRIYIRS